MGKYVSDYDIDDALLSEWKYISFPSNSLRPEIVEWLNKHTERRWTVQYGVWNASPIDLHFENETDCVLFKMTWL